MNTCRQKNKAVRGNVTNVGRVSRPVQTKPIHIRTGLESRPTTTFGSKTQRRKRRAAVNELPIPEPAARQPFPIDHAEGCRSGTDLPTL